MLACEKVLITFLFKKGNFVEIKLRRVVYFEGWAMEMVRGAEKWLRLVRG